MENLKKSRGTVSRVGARRRVPGKRRSLGAGVTAAILLTLFGPGARTTARAQIPPTLLDPNLAVRTVAAGLDNPTTMAFLGPNDILVLEKNTGKVQRVVNGAVQSTVLDLPVNFGSERGLLGIALHPDFQTNGYVYLRWTESPTGVDSGNLADLGSLWFSLEPLRTNRVDRFLWDGSTLTFDRNLIKLHSYQADAGQPLRGNHNGGILRFGPDGKLYIIMGDNGRRGFMQNITSGFGPNGMDDQFGGPEPDDVHLTGVILRLNDDGTTPVDNPFYQVGAEMGGEVGANIQKLYGYGVRNSFGMTFDPISGDLWESENGDDSFGEINRFEAGFNGGWTQIMGPVSRIAQYKQIETTPPYAGLQQIRWPPELIADTPEEALSRLYMLPGAHYSDPIFSWKYEVSPTGLGFLSSGALGGDPSGEEYRGSLFVGSAVPTLQGGFLFRFKMAADRRDIRVDDPRLDDRVADNRDKYDITESESLQFGMNFGAVTDIQTGPNGNLFVVSISRGAIYEIYRP